MLTCDHDAATVTVMSWVGEGDVLIIPTYVLGWRDGETACSETRTARIADIPYDALDGDVGLGGSVTIALPSIGDTFVIASDG